MAFGVLLNRLNLTVISYFQLTPIFPFSKSLRPFSIPFKSLLNPIFLNRLSLLESVEGSRAEGSP